MEWIAMRRSLPQAFQGAATVAVLGWTLGSMCSVASPAAGAQEIDNVEAVRRVDAAIHARYDAVAAYTVTEHYTVFRSGNETAPAAEMTVKTTYRRETGKTYSVVSESGSTIIRKFGLEPLLENEKRVNDAANREAFWFTSANYEMKLKAGKPEPMDGVDCLAIAIVPKRKAPNLIVGTIWVDVNDFQIVRIEGTGTKSSSMWTGPARVVRQYARFSGFSQATHAHAETDSSLFGKTVVVIDYQDYQVELRKTP